jgi:hypothetical protein
MKRRGGVPAGMTISNAPEETDTRKQIRSSTIPLRKDEDTAMTHSLKAKTTVVSH